MRSLGRFPLSFLLHRLAILPCRLRVGERLSRFLVRHRAAFRDGLYGSQDGRGIIGLFVLAVWHGERYNGTDLIPTPKWMT